MLRATTLVNPEQINAIWAKWDALAGLRSRPYCCPAWMMAWWSHVAPPRALLRVIAVFDGDELLALAPFFCDRGFGAVNRYRLLAAAMSAPLDILARPGTERAVGPLIAAELARADPAPDAIMFEGVPGDSPWPGLLCELRQNCGPLNPHKQFAQAEPFITLSGSTYDEWLASKSSNWRRKLRHEWKTAVGLGATVRLSSSREELSRDLEALAALHHARWKKRGGSGVLDARVERMLAEAGDRLLDEGRFRLFSMELDGRIVSSDLFLVAGGEVDYWLGGFDEGETRVRRPGIMTVRYALEHAFSAGDRILSLGPGGQAYKYELTPTTRSVEWILLVPRGLRSLIALAQLAPLRTRIVLAQHLHPKAKRLVRRVLQWRATRARH